MKHVLLFCIVIFVTMVLNTTAFSQKNCEVVDIQFACPEYYSEIRSADPSIRIFKYLGEGSDLYFFISVPTGRFDPNTITEVLLTSKSFEQGQKFAWKAISEPFVMGTKTKYKYVLSSSFGLSSKYLVEVKSFGFDVSGKKFVLGYLSDWSESEAENRLAFESARGTGDHAAGCNATLSVLNSITNEFPEKRQYCYLSGLKSN